MFDHQTFDDDTDDPEDDAHNDELSPPQSETEGGGEAESIPEQ